MRCLNAANRGLFFRIFDPQSALLDLRTPAPAGTAVWTPLELTFQVSPATRLLQIQLSREPSSKFDNELAGTVWIDRVELAPTL
jgi:hypothetical protein